MRRPVTKTGVLVIVIQSFCVLLRLPLQLLMRQALGLPLLGLISLWLIVAAACAAATPDPTPQPAQPTPIHKLPTTLPTLEYPYVFKDILYDDVTLVQSWNVLSENNIKDHPEVIDAYLDKDAKRIYIHVINRKDINSLLAFLDHLGIPGSASLVIVEGDTAPKQ